MMLLLPPTRPPLAHSLWSAQHGSAGPDNSGRRQTAQLHPEISMEFEPEAERANVRILIDKGELLRQYRFRNSDQRYAYVKGNGNITLTDDEVIWDLPRRRSPALLSGQ
ncbi:MAG: hypothetical protein IPM37_03265 [Hahellaceae bacterium]|nr:hypothetical protein [Hahellaceae bacterium]